MTENILGKNARWDSTNHAAHVVQVDANGNITGEGGVQGSPQLASAQTIGTSLTALENGPIDVSALSSIMFWINETGGSVALDQFEIAISVDTTNYQIAYNTTADFTSPEGILIGCGADNPATGDLTNLAASGSGWFIMDVMGLNSVRIRVAAASASATIDANYSGR